MISAGSPGCTVPTACCDGATHASICRVLRWRRRALSPELDGIEAERVDHVSLLDGALHDTDPLAGRELVEAGDGRSGRHHEREVAEVIAVGESDGAAARLGGGDRRRPDVEAPRRHLRQQTGELGADEIDLEAQLLVIARSSSLSNPVNWPAELMQMLVVRRGADGQGARRAESQCVDVDTVQRLHGRRGGGPRRDLSPRPRGWWAARWRSRIPGGCAWSDCEPTRAKPSPSRRSAARRALNDN